MNADNKTNPSAADMKPSGWVIGAEKRVGKWVKVIMTSIKPRNASNSHRRDMAWFHNENKTKKAVNAFPRCSVNSYLFCYDQLREMKCLAVRQRIQQKPDQA